MDFIISYPGLLDQVCIVLLAQWVGVMIDPAPPAPHAAAAVIPQLRYQILCVCVNVSSLVVSLMEYRSVLV